jgi:hypothetical protein
MSSEYQGKGLYVKLAMVKPEVIPDLQGSSRSTGYIQGIRI